MESKKAFVLGYYHGWLDKIGTVSFEPSIMYNRIHIDRNNPSSLDFTGWLSFVPDVFREMAKEAIKQIGSKILFDVLNDDLIIEFIVEFHRLAVRAYEDEQTLTRQGWKRKSAYSRMERA